MKVISKICPTCQTPFEAKRKNQLYCSDDCRADANNQKQTAKYHNIKTLEKDKAIGDRYKADFLNAIRIVMVDYDEDGKNEVITFEGRKYKKDATSAKIMPQFGFAFQEGSVKNGRRVSVYIPQESAICLLDKYIRYASNEEITYRLMRKKKIVAS
jgi:hypothetical protein